MGKVTHRSAHRALAAVLLLLVSHAASGQTTAFTYQGQLSDAGALANGSYDLRFALFDSAAGGAQIGANQTVPTVAVSGGVFTVQLDFGVNAFPGANRFVEIGVKPAGGGSFTTLAPRQQISSSPYAIRTLSAATADALSSACVGCVMNAQINSVAGSKLTGTIPPASVPTGSGSYVQNTATPQLNANFNISGNGTLGGTLSASKVEIAAQDGLRISGFQPYLTLSDTNAGGKRGLVSTGNGDLGFYTNSSIGTVPTLLIKDISGNVGIGSASPTAKLTVSGAGAFNAPGAPRFDLFNSAANTGYLQHVTDGGLWQIATSGGATRMVIDPSGNVGIGTTSPVSGRLQVDGGSANSGVYATTGATNVPGMYGGSSGLNGTGVIGEANSGPTAYGVWGKSTSGFGVFGQSSLYGVYGKSPGADAKGSSFAVYAEGDLKVTGSAVVAGNVYAFGDVFANDFHTTSDRNLKANFSNVEPRAILHNLVSIPIQTWNFQSQPEAVRHLGPMAQDFHAAFDLGEDDKHISTLDADGVALAAIQGLYQIVQEKDRQLQELQVRVRKLERQVEHKRAGGGP